MSLQIKTAFQASGRLRFFLFGFRWIAVIWALLLTNFNAITPDLPNPLPASVAAYPQLINLILILYHIGASLYGFKCLDKKFSIYLLIFADVCMGGFMTYYFGLHYFLAAYILPTLEASFFFGSVAAFLGLIFIGAAYLPLLGIQLLTIIKDPNLAAPSFNYLKIYMLASAGLVWLFSSAVAQEEEDFNITKKINEEKNLAFEELQNTKTEIKAVFNELESRQTTVVQLQNELQKTKEELEEVYRRLHESRLQAQATHQLVQEKETQLEKKLKVEVQEVQNKLEEEVKLSNLLKAWLKYRTAEEISVNIVNELLNFIPSQTCLLFLREESEGGKKVLFAEVAASPYSDYFRNFSLHMGEGAPGLSALTKQPLKIDQGTMKLGDIEISTLLTYEKSAIVAPMVYNEECLGVLYLGRAESNAFDSKHYDFLQKFAGTAAISLNNAASFQSVVSSGLLDEVSKLYNVTYFQERCLEESKRAQRYHYPITLILLDIDKFSLCNESYGKEFCDNILRQVADIMKLHTRETDVLARLQNDDFALLLIQSEKSNAVVIADRIRMAVAVRSFMRGRDKVNITLSIGVSSLPQDAANKEDLITKAEKALQQAKATGGNKTILA
jgi:diguanylate cyclase (GGDEF)-like protein